MILKARRPSLISRSSATASYVATTTGFAVADKSTPSNLKAPDNWRSYDNNSHPELTSNDIRRVAWFDSSLYVATASGLYRLDSPADTLVNFDFGATSEFTDMVIQNDTLWVFSASGFGHVDRGVVFYEPATGMPSWPRTGARSSSRMWLAARVGGLFYSIGGVYERYDFEGLPDNYIRDISITDDGLTTILPYEGSPHELHDGMWVERPIVYSSHTNAIAVDRLGHNWIATWGGGTSLLGDTVARYTHENSTLRGVSEGPGYIVVTDLVASGNYVYMALFRAVDGVRVGVADLTAPDILSRWTSFGVSDGIIGDRIATVDFYNGALAIGSQENGLYYLYVGDDPYETGTDTLARYYEDSPDFRKRIVSDLIRVARFSPDGELWVGTNSGLTRLDRGIELFVNVDLPDNFGPDISAIEFDSRGNVWVGAANGLVCYEAVDGGLQLCTSRNSGLVHDAVVALTFDDNTGDMYVATQRGVSIRQSTIGRPTENLDSVYAFPNPFRVTSPDDRLNFNYAGQATLRIFTIAGELVAELPEPVWDGRNQVGEPVSSGVYIFVLNDRASEVGRGKILLVRQ